MEAFDDTWRARFVRGERAAIERLYRETFESVRRAAGRVLREPADRDAVVQQVFADVVQSRSLRVSFRGGTPGPWLSAIARHRALDFARRERRLCAFDEADESGPSCEGGLQDFRRELERFAERLPAERRRLLELRFVAGMTQMEASAAMGVPRSTLEDWEKQIKRLLEDHLLRDERRAGGRETESKKEECA